jgi:hypothetical protein
MIKGLDKFRAHFANYADRYVLIGGTASMLAMNELGQDFRATRDLDIVLCIEALDKEFAQAFWDFVKAGGYANCQRSKSPRQFYRFDHPQDASYPDMLELFSRVPDVMEPVAGAHLTPIPVSEEVSSLSAILLDDDYYNFIHQSRTTIDGLSVVEPTCIIPLKARAFLDLSNRKASGEHVDSTDIKKHRSDILRLFNVLDLSQTIEIPQSIKDDLSKCFERMRQEVIDPKQFGIRNRSLEDVLETLEKLYGIK